MSRYPSPVRRPALVVLLLPPVVAFARSASAQPVAAARLDVDGDGANDSVSVEAEGRVVVVRAGRNGPGAVASAQLGAPVRRLLSADVGVYEVEGHRLLVVRATRDDADDHPRRQAFVLEWGRDQLSPRLDEFPPGESGVTTKVLQQQGQGSSDAFSARDFVAFSF
jgi:hypothetical protein